MKLYGACVTVCLMVILGVTAGQKNKKPIDDICPVKFPDGFFCNSICKNWGILSGATFLCFVSDNGQYHRFVARYPTFGIWRFYNVDTESEVEELCQRSVTGDEFYLNQTEVMCGVPKIKRFHAPTHVRRRPNRDIGKPLKRNDDERHISMDAVCQLATTQLCRQNRIIHCPTTKACCYAETTPEACAEENLSHYNDCYQVLGVIMDTLLV